jgi:hypothetical protein
VSKSALRQPEIVIECEEGWIVGPLFVGESHMRASTAFTATQVIDGEHGPQVRGAGENSTTFHKTMTMVQIPSVTEDTIIVFTNFYLDGDQKHAATTYFLVTPTSVTRVRYADALAHFGVDAPPSSGGGTFTPKR